MLPHLKTALKCVHYGLRSCRCRRKTGSDDQKVLCNFLTSKPLYVSLVIFVILKGKLIRKCIFGAARHLFFRRRQLSDVRPLPYFISSVKLRLRTLLLEYNICVPSCDLTEPFLHSSVLDDESLMQSKPSCVV